MAIAFVAGVLSVLSLFLALGSITSIEESYQESGLRWATDKITLSILFLYVAVDMARLAGWFS